MPFPLQVPPGMTLEQFRELQARYALTHPGAQSLVPSYQGVRPGLMTGTSPLAVQPFMLPGMGAQVQPQIGTPPPGGFAQYNPASGRGPVYTPPARPAQRAAPPAMGMSPGDFAAGGMLAYPQEHDESYGHYLARRVASAPYRFSRWGADQASRLVSGFAETPDAATARRSAAIQNETAGGGVAGPQTVAQAFGAQAGTAPFDVTGFFRGLEHSGANAVSPAGARGSMQVMPATAENVARAHGIPWNSQLYMSDRPEGDTYRTQLGTAHGTDLLQRYGNPIIAAAAYNAGEPRVDRWLQQYGDPRTGQVDMANWVSRIPIDETRNYAIRAMGMTGPTGANGMPIPPMAFDPTQYNRAIDLIGQAGRLAEQPTSVSFNPGPAPTLPAPTPIAPTDFSGVTRELEAAQPAEFTTQQQHRLQRRGVLAGIARGLASVDLSARGGAGVGQLFAAVGAGALAGRASADEEIQQREDLHDQQMHEWHRLMASNELARAQDVAQTIRYNGQQAYDHSLRLFNMSYNEWFERAHPVVQNGRTYTTEVNAQTGERTIRSAAIDHSALAGAMMAQAQIMQSIGAGQNQVGMANWQFNAAHIMAGAAASGQPQDMATAISTRIAELLQSGAINSVVSESDMQELSQAAQQSAMLQVPLTMTGTQADEQRATIMQTQLIAGLTARAMQDAQLRAMLMGGSGQLAAGAVRAQRGMSASSSTTTRQTGTGLPTISSTVRQ